MQSEKVNEVPELSLMEGGPGDALMKRLRLIRADSALHRREPREKFFVAPATPQ
jgi:hypothetical protein